MSLPDEIEKLAKLRRDEVITQAEFEAAKAKLIAGTPPSIPPQPILYDKGVPEERKGLGCGWIAVITLLVIGAVVALWALKETFKPNPRAEIGIQGNVLRITNVGAESWTSVQLTLNDAFDGATLDVPGEWHPRTAKSFNLSDFKGRLSKQSFDPDYDRVRKLFIVTSSHQLGTVTYVP